MESAGHILQRAPYLICFLFVEQVRERDNLYGLGMCEHSVKKHVQDTCNAIKDGKTVRNCWKYMTLQ